MSNYIGPKQQALTRTMRRGSLLFQERGRWYTTDAVGLNRRYHNGERCMGLYVRGFIMAEQEETRTRYVLTEKGKRVC